MSTRARKSKVNTSHLAPIPTPVDPALLEIFPDVLMARSLRFLVERIVTAHHRKQPVIFTMGAHPVKLGLAPVLIDLMKRGIVTYIGTNGASIVHDIELSLFGETSEEVIPGLVAGTFGMTEETREIGREAINKSRVRGLGASIGQWLIDTRCENVNQSLFATAQSRGRPITVHVTIGADILHMDGDLDGGKLGRKSLEDFWQMYQRIWELSKQGGVLVNWGSAVTMPEVILKCLAIARSRGLEFDGVAMFDLDMIRQYRSQTRIVDAANALGGEGFAITMPHEISLPLTAGLVLGLLEEK